MAEPTDHQPILPMSRVRGHEKVITRLGREIEQHRVHHAHLFAGPEGIGKAVVARAFAQRLLCATPKGIDACGTCPACLKCMTNNHPDWLWVEPDGASIKIRQAREIAAATRYRPNEGDRRVIVIEQVETMADPAANALLKTIEEPGGQTLFILLTASPNRLLPTIRSRCAIVHFAALSAELTRDILLEHGVDAAKADTLARLSQGSPGQALRMFEQVTWEERESELAALIQIANGNAFAGMRLASEIAENTDRVDLDARFVAWLWIMRDVAVVLSTGRIDLVHNQDQERGIQKLAHLLSAPRVFDWIDALERARMRIQGNVNLRLILESLVLEFDERPA